MNARLPRPPRRARPGAIARPATGARAALERALALHGDHPIALNSLGVLLMDLGDHAGAELCFRRALAVLPEHPLARENLAALVEETRSALENDEPLVGQVGDESDDV